MTAYQRVAKVVHWWEEGNYNNCYLIHGYSPGTAVITFTPQYGNVVTLNVTVTAAGSISVSHSTVNVPRNGYVDVTVTHPSGQTVTAVSSLPIAVGVTKQSSTSTKTVFRIGGLSLCTGATVTYTASGGSTATTTVNIVAPDATSVTLSKSTLSLNVGSTYTLSATVLPSGASQSVTWSVYSGSACASVSSTGKVTAKAAGTAVIRATAASGAYASCTVTVGMGLTTASVANGLYYIRNIRTGKYLDVSGGTAADDTNVIVHAFNGNANQQWYVEIQSDNSYKIMSNVDRGYCLDLRGGTNANGTNIHIYHNLENSAQRWYFHKKGNNLVIRPKNSTTRVADVHYNQNDPEQYATNVHLYHYTGDDNQLWVLEPAVPDSFNELIDQGLISMSDIQCTDDDFFICTKSIADILNSKGNYTIKISEEGNYVFINVNKFYDDWYIYAVPGDNNSFIYGLYKMREQENDYNGGFGDGDDPGVTISFVEFDTSILFDYLQTNDSTNRDVFDSHIDYVIRDENAVHNNNIKDYFINAANSGSYLIARSYGVKIASTAVNGKIYPSNKFMDMIESEDPLNFPRVSRLLTALYELNLTVGYVLFDFDTFAINIYTQPNHTNYEEMLAIMITHTANTAFVSFAAEVKFHAYALESWHNNLPWISGKLGWYKRALRSDMAIGEEAESGLFDIYYNLESSLVQEQIYYHGLH